MTRIAIVCFDGVTDLDVFLHWDILSRPKTMFPIAGESWSVELLGTQKNHTTQAGLQVAMHAGIEAARTYDAVIHASGRDTRRMMNDQVYLDALGLDPKRQFVAAQCSGSLILAASGCLTGLTSTTYPTARTDLESFGVVFVQEPVVAHDRVATAAGCLAGLKLDEWLLSQFISSERVSKCIGSASPWGDGLD